MHKSIYKCVDEDTMYKHVICDSDYKAWSRAGKKGHYMQIG